MIQPYEIIDYVRLFQLTLLTLTPIPLPSCAVWQAQGCCVCPQTCFVYLVGCWYTMFCWDPTAGKGGAPAEAITDADKMER